MKITKQQLDKLIEQRVQKILSEVLDASKLTEDDIKDIMVDLQTDNSESFPTFNQIQRRLMNMGYKLSSTDLQNIKQFRKDIIYDINKEWRG